MRDGKLVKNVSTPRFYVDLFETENGTYYVRYKRKNCNVQYSQDISDLTLALRIFDMKLSECEGH